MGQIKGWKKGAVRKDGTEFWHNETTGQIASVKRNGAVTIGMKTKKYATKSIGKAAVLRAIKKQYKSLILKF